MGEIFPFRGRVSEGGSIWNINFKIKSRLRVQNEKFQAHPLESKN